MAMARAILDGVTLGYVEAGAGPPAVLVHGMACGWRMWRSQIRALRPHYRTIAYDHRGHGCSSAPDDAAAYSQVILADDLAGLIRHLGLAPARVIGLSLGGAVAIELAIRHPALVAALVLADAGSGSDDPEAARRLCDDWAAQTRAHGIDRFAALMLASPFFDTYAARGRRARCHLEMLVRRHPAHGLAHVLAQAIGRRPPVYARAAELARLTQPTLVICGERDRVCRKPADFLAKTIPGAELVILPKLGHMTNLEAPQLFNATILDFLGRAGTMPGGTIRSTAVNQ
jgi:pimeloyl-ACP methyl ester carboxylesterase